MLLWTFGGMILAEEKRSALLGAVSVSQYPQQIPHRLPWNVASTAALRRHREKAVLMDFITLSHGLKTAATTLSWRLENVVS